MTLIQQPPPGLSGKQLREEQLRWQSRVLMLLVLPLAAVYLALESAYALHVFSLAVGVAILISALFAVLVWRLRAATAWAAICGGILTACVYFGSISPLNRSWIHSGIVPLLALFVLTYLATKYRRGVKERQGTAEPKQGRDAAQVCANLGVAALVQAPGVLIGLGLLLHGYGVGFVYTDSLWLAPMLAALAEAAADTVSSEVGQVLGGTPRMLTTLKAVPAGTDGAISFAGTTAGCSAAAVVIGMATIAMKLDLRTAAIALAAGVFGLFFDSLLGASLERRGWLNNDAVNFLSTLAAAASAFAILAGLN